MNDFWDWKRTAVLSIDIQKAIEPGQPWAVESMEQLLDGAELALDACRKAGIPIIHAAYCLDPSGVDAMKFEAVDGTGRPLHSVRGSYDAQICERVKPLPGEHVLEKQKFTAFYGTRLESMLSRLDITSLVVFGVWTEACVETTVYDAVWRNFRVALVKDACASATRFMHKTACLDMANWLYGGMIINSGQLQKAVRNEAYKAWKFESPCSFPYTAESINEMYESLDP